jgi:hypothetical protein
MSSERIGADGKWPRVPKFDIPDLPPGGDQLVLDEEDERILDKVWADIRSRPARIFGRTLPPLADRHSGATPPLDGHGRSPAADAEIPVAERDRINGPAERAAKRASIVPSGA